MKGLPLISVVIPAYNTESYIGETLDCVISQTYQNLQIIVIDDGSSDHTKDIVRRYMEQDKRIELIENSRGGVSRARNTGIEKAKGEKIFFWDSNDIIEPKAIEEVVEFGISQNVNSVLYGYADYINGVKEPPHKHVLKNKYTGNEIVNELMPSFLGHSFEDVRNWIQGKQGMRERKELTALWRIMVDSQVIKVNHLRFDEKLSLGEDTKFINEYFLYEQSVGFLDQCYYYLRRRDSGANMTSNRNPVLMTENKLKLIDARKELDQIAQERCHIDTSVYWEGTVVFSAVQLALNLAKAEGSTKSNFTVYKSYMENKTVKKKVQNLHPGTGIKSIPFYLIKRKFYVLFFGLCKMMPSKIINKLM